MKAKIVLLLIGLLVVSCGAEESSSNLGQAENDDSLDQGFFDEDDFDSDFDDYVEEDDPELGKLVVELMEDSYDNVAYCNLLITRVPDEGFANVIVSMSLEGDPTLASAQAYNEDDLTSGEVNLSGTQTSSAPFSISSADYAPPHIIIDGEDQTWVFDFYDPRGSFEMLIDGADFDALSSDDRDADNMGQAPHLWEVAMQFEVGLLKPTTQGEELRSTGKFDYQGLCNVAVKYLEL